MINRQAQPERLRQGDSRFTEVVDYIRRVSANEGFGIRFVVDDNMVCVSLS
jgi:hypothetical protein